MATRNALLLCLLLGGFALACGGSRAHSSSRGMSAAASAPGGPSQQPDSDYDAVMDGSDMEGDDAGGSMDEAEYMEPEPAPAALTRGALASAPSGPGTPAPRVPAPLPKAAPNTLPKASPVKASTSERRPMLIYRAVINLAVFEARKSIDSIEKLAKDAGGYLVARSDLSITIRVPAERFDESLETISKVGDELHREVSVQDVTAEFRDLQIRLSNLQVVRERLAALLSRAQSVEEALKVERELERVAGNIERIKGKLKLFSELVAFSTISVNFQARPVETLRSEVALPFPWLNDLGLGQLLDLD